jgi:hypothetical protein
MNYKELSKLVYTDNNRQRDVSDLVNFDYKKILDPPPKSASYETYKELIFVVKEANNRSNADLDLVYGHDKDMDQYFIKITGKENYPKEYIDTFYKAVEPVLQNTKAHFNRPRPHQVAPFYDIILDRIVTDTIHTPSYPSGHTFYSRLVSNILSDMYPEHTKMFYDVVIDTAMARVKQGVHFPTDNRASITLADYVYGKLKNNIG